MAKEIENRKCVLTGNVLPKEQLLRFILMRDGTVLPDFNKKLEGHGFYISNSRKMLQDLVLKKNPLNKILHTKTVISEDLPQIVEKILLQTGLNALNLARKAGNLVLGFEKVKETISKGKAAFVIEATDAADDGKQKITAMAEAKNVKIYTVFDIDTVSTALNRDTTVHIAIKQGPMCEPLRAALERYQTYMKE